MVEANGAQHVFVSYVREDADQVDTLCRVLDAAGVPYWRDRKALAPGDAWKAKIRAAIGSGAVVFLACFSSASRARDKSYMNEELTLAVEEYRKMPPGRTWLIPVRLDDGPIPEWDLGGSRTLSDINYVDFFGPESAVGAAALIGAITTVMGSGATAPETVQAAVEELAAAERPAALRRRTKDMLLDPARRIQLDDLLSTEITQILSAMRDESRFPTQSLAGARDDQQLALVALATDYWLLVEPFCWSLQVAARFADPAGLAPWASGLRALCVEGNKPRGGRTDLVDLTCLPGLVAVFTAALACVGQGRWDNLKALLIDTMAPASPYTSTSLVSLVEATDPWRPFRHGDDLTPNLLARTAKTELDPAAALAVLVNRQAGKYRTPIAEWLHAVLRPAFAEQFPDEDAYDRAFDRAEVVLGLLSEDQEALAAAEQPDRSWRRGSAWFGRSTWRAIAEANNALTEIQVEQRRQGVSWPPLQAGLFGGDLARAQQAATRYAEAFNDRSWRYS